LLTRYIRIPDHSGFSAVGAGAGGDIGGDGQEALLLLVS
jgi:hypothetical protein